MSLSLVTDAKELSIPCASVTIETGKSTGMMLVQYLKESNGGWLGIAANQLGINQRVCALSTVSATSQNNRFFYFINPQIIQKSGQFRFKESCLSFPGQEVDTLRFETVTIKADNIEGSVSFYADPEKWQYQAECACIQHEIDHLNGITMFSRIAKAEQYIRNELKVGRNDLCPCGSEKKYKKCCL